jgi:uncharacterized protein (DUF2235 family)
MTGGTKADVLRRALAIDEQQVSYYRPGVGTMGSPNARTWLGKQLDLVRGLAFGYGITLCISDAYLYLIQTYEPDDHIYLSD